MNTRKGFEGELRAQLSPGESPLSVADLRVPKRITTATSFFSVVVFIRLFDEVRNRFKMKETRRQLSANQIPIARRMMVCVTERRILIWNHSTWHSARRYLGSVESQRIRATELQRSTHVNWNVITLQIQDGPRIRLLIDQQSAQQFAGTLNADTIEQKVDPESTST
jgi:hypothetical protein